MAHRIDDSHQPFKRAGKIGPGPKRRPAIFEEKHWECRKGKNTRTHYVQVCTWIGPGKRKPLKVKTNKKKHLAYMKNVYRPWAKTHRAKLTARGAKRGYHCRKTPATKCR